jgi:NAD(P)-dependent dehydrogenase (short-subunit alcohol dehydrogenase family)
VVVDVTDADQVAALPQVVPATLDALVNNAGIVVGGPIEAVPLAEVRRQLEVNVVGQIGVTQALLPAIRRATGRVVFVSSLSGRVSSPMTGAYSASKYALEAVADALRLEVRPWGIDVVLVEPAQTDTDMWRTADDLLDEVVGDLSPETRTLYAKHIDGQRVAIPKARKMAAPVEGAAETVERALTTRHPRARYVVGTAPRALAALLPFVPTRLRDLMLASSGGVPRRV